MKFAVPFRVLWNLELIKSEAKNKTQTNEWIRFKLDCFVNMRWSKNILSKAQDDLISISCGEEKGDNRDKGSPPSLAFWKINSHVSSENSNFDTS